MQIDSLPVKSHDVVGNNGVHAPQLPVFSHKGAEVVALDNGSGKHKNECTGSLSSADVDLVGTFMITDSGGNSLADVNQFLVTGATPGAVADIILLTLEAQLGQTGDCVGCLSWQEIE